jgi:hypothetical protein
MITGKVIKPYKPIEIKRLDYINLEALNCSAIKLFDNNPIQFYNEFILKKRRKKDVKSTALIIGDLVDFYLLECKADEQSFEDRVEEKFALYKEVKPKGQVGELADKIIEITKEHLQEDGSLPTSFETRFAEALRRVQDDGKYKNATVEKALANFTEKALDYFKFSMDNIDKTIVDISLLDKSRTVAKILKNDEFTKECFEEKEDVELYPKFIIEWKYKDFPCKSEIDLLVIDHKHKIISPKDLKTTYDNENFEYGYLKYRYDLQAAFYHLAVDWWRNQEGLEKYKVEPMEFIVGDTSYNNRRPVRYPLSQKDLDAGLYGFSLYGKQYKGIISLIEEILWADENNIWDASRELIENNGVLKLGIKYD